MYVSLQYLTIHVNECHSLIIHNHLAKGEEKMHETNYSTPRRGSSGLAAFLIGGLIGGTIALLYAPQSGKKTREFLVNEGQQTADQVMKSIREAQASVLATIEDAQARMETMNRETRERLQKLQEIARETIGEEKEVLQRRYKEAKDVVRE